MVEQTQLSVLPCAAHILTLDGSLQVHITLIYFQATEFNNTKTMNW